MGELGGRLVCREEGMVLPCSWKGLPRTGRWLRSCRRRSCSLRLQRRLRQLDGRMECAKEGLVLQECWQGLPPPISGRLCLKAQCGPVSSARGALACVPSSGDSQHASEPHSCLRRPIPVDTWILKKHNSEVTRAEFRAGA